MNVLSLFDGMSCGRIALERAGVPVTNYFASEVDKYAIKVAQANYPDTVQLGDIRNVSASQLPHIDLILGGSPCQGFSFAGKQGGLNDPRSALFYEYVRLLGEVQSYNPQVRFLLENVKMKRDSLALISLVLGVEPEFINSALVSAQNRQRYYWTNIPDVCQPEDRGIVLADIIEGAGTGWIKNHGEWHSRNEKSMCVDANYFKGVDNHGQRTMIKGAAMRGRYIVDGKRADHKVASMAGKTEQRIEVREDNKTNALTTVQKDTLLVRSFNRNDGLGKALDKSYTLNASDWRGLNRNQNQNAVTNGAEYRKLTPVECERLQTVPDNYTNHVSNTQRYKMLGNGWTVDVIAHLMMGLL